MQGGTGRHRRQRGWPIATHRSRNRIRHQACGRCAPQSRQSEQLQFQDQGGMDPHSTRPEVLPRPTQ
uniref:Uncharacterized protein n=1 Tax=Tanacetum cinerariifolium TaxID=118510 RepID=A0A699WZ46_TANCI|nr:hypothetical protein [Tanacetum cinerariifolium]